MSFLSLYSFEITEGIILSRIVHCLKTNSISRLPGFVLQAPQDLLGKVSFVSVSSV